MCKKIIAAALLSVMSAGTLATAQTPDLSRFETWGLEISNEIESGLRLPGSSLYRERTGSNTPSFIWPASTQLRAMTSRLELDPANTLNRSRLLGFSNQLQSDYWNASPDNDNGYAVLPGSTERFYDDNAHMTVALVEAYDVSGESIFLQRAIATHAFVLEGENNEQGGGIYFKEGQGGPKNSVSTLQAARGAAMLFQATGQQSFLDDATRLLTWAEANVQAPDGMYYQDARDPIDTLPNTPLTNAAGMGILTNLELFDITGDNAYLDEAERIGQALDARYFLNNGQIGQEGYWAFEAVDAFVDLYERTGDDVWLTNVTAGLDFLHANTRDVNGHYGPNWGQSYTDQTPWFLNDNAAVARAYLYTSMAAIPEPGAAMLLVLTGPMLLRRRG